MPWYAICYKETGELYSVGSVVDFDNLPDHFECLKLSDNIDFNIQKWDSANKTVISRESEVKQKTLDERLSDLEAKIDSIIEVRR